jgi:hypothetical protein
VSVHLAPPPPKEGGLPRDADVTVSLPDRRPVIASFVADPRSGPCNAFARVATTKATMLSWTTTDADTVTLKSFQVFQKKKRRKAARRTASVAPSGSQVRIVDCGGGLFGGTLFTLTATNRFGSVTSDLVVAFD